MPLLRRRFEELRPFEEMEVNLVRASVRARGSVAEPDEAALRYALGLARLWQIRAPFGHDVAVAGHLAEYRDQLRRALEPLLLGASGVDPAALPQAAGYARTLARDAFAGLTGKFGQRIPAESIDHEVRHKSLVVVAGGGGGSCYVHLGAFALLETAGLRPALISGTSMGAILGLFRARSQRFDVESIPAVVSDLTFRKVFSIVSSVSRFGLPAWLRLQLRESIGPHFLRPDGAPLTLGDLKVPMLVTVTGIRRGMLPHPLEYYEKLFAVDPAAFRPWALRRIIGRATDLIGEFFRTPQMVKKLVLGASEETRHIDALDAVGFSSAVPAVIHYDVLRDDPRAVELFEGLMRRHDLFRLVDGGVADNVPARSAWRAVQRGLIGTRNVFILALDGFAPRLTAPLWLPLQQLVHENVRRNKHYAHHFKAFHFRPSPLDLIPSAGTVRRAVEHGKDELIEDLPFIERMMAPLPALERGAP